MRGYEPANGPSGVFRRAGESSVRDRIEIKDRLGVDHSSPVPLYHQLSQYIEGHIKEKQWRPGQLLPSEQEICDRAGVSRTVVRQALAALERVGLVSKQSGKRSTVAIPKYDGGLMQNLTGFHEDAIAMGQKPSTQVLDLRVEPASDEVAERLRLDAGAPTVMLNRLRFLDGEPEVLVATFLPQHRCPALVDEDLTDQSLYELLDRKYGLRIVEGFRTIEAVSLERADARLLRVKAGSPALLLRSVGYTADGSPLEYFVAKHRGDRSKFGVRLLRSYAPSFTQMY